MTSAVLHASVFHRISRLFGQIPSLLAELTRHMSSGALRDGSRYW